MQHLGQTAQRAPVSARLAVFRHLLTTGKGEVPSREEVGLD